MLTKYAIMLFCSAFLCCGSSFAQTTRIQCKTNKEGCHASYREVYEYDYVSEKPTFPGGNTMLVKYINNTRQYPAEAYRNHIQGRVTLSFVINTDGSVSDVCVLRGVEPSLNQEAMRIISSMPQWHPGKMNGKLVPVRVIQTVPFRL